MSNEHNNAPAVPDQADIDRQQLRDACARFVDGNRKSTAPAVPQGYPVLPDYVEDAIERCKSMPGHPPAWVDMMRSMRKALGAATPAPAPAQEPVDMVPRAALHEVERERDWYKTRAQTMHEHQNGQVWYWQGDGEDHPETLVNSLPVVIRADQLRELIAKPAQEVTQSEPIYQLQRGDGSWIDQDKASYDYNAQYGINTIRIVYTAPAPAQEVSDKHEREMLEVINERDRINEWADQLADAIAKHTGYEIGEHTSENNPWRMALNALVCHEAKQEVGLTLAAEDVHAAFAKNFPKSRISQAWINFAADIAQAIAARAAQPEQEVGLTGPVVAWRMRDTGFRRPKYVYFDTKEQAVAHAAQLLQSRDDGHLTELTPLCEASTGTDLLDALRDNSWKLEPFEMPTGQGDADIGWRVVGFYMGKPKERIEATVYTDDPAAAIIAALRAKGGKL